MNNSLSKLNSETIKIIHNRILTPTVSSTIRNFLFGAGLFYSIDNKKYSHIPLVTLFPVAYSGYHIYKNKDTIAASNTLNLFRNNPHKHC